MKDLMTGAGTKYLAISLVVVTGAPIPPPRCEGGMKILAHFLLPAAAFAIANQVGNHAGSNVPMNVLAVVLIAAGIGYIYIIVRH
jgi:hypothetical protein